MGNLYLCYMHKYLRGIVVCLYLFSGLTSMAQPVGEVDSLKNLLAVEKTDSNKITLFYKISRTYWFNNFDSALFYARNGLALAERTNNRKGKADCLNALGAVNWMHRNYATALDYTLQNLAIRKEIRDETGIFNANNNLGLIYYEIENDSLALYYSMQALAAAKHLNDPVKIAKASINIGLVYSRLGKNNEAMTLYYNALGFAKRANDVVDIIYIKSNIGEIFMETKPDKALVYFQESLALAEQTGNKEMAGANLTYISSLKLKENKADEAISLSGRGFTIASEIGDLKVMSLAAENLYKGYKLKNDFKKSLFYLEKSKNLQDSMLNDDKLKKIADLKLQFEMNEKQKQIEILQKNNLIARHAATNQKLKFGFILALIIVLTFVVFYFYRNMQQKKQDRERKDYERQLIEAKNKAEENNKLKSAFLANMSHEIRTPLNAVVGFANLLQKPNVPDHKQQRYISLIKSRSFDLLRIIEDILDISNLEVGQIKINETVADVSNLMIELYDYYKLKMDSRITRPEFELMYYVDKSLENTELIFDGQRVRQILINLLDNAFKYTESGYIAFGCDLSDNSHLLFYVKDTGIGIPESKQKLIFDRFTQLEELNNNMFQTGTGLGLSIVKGLIDLMSGKIWVESKEDEGSTFWFVIPVRFPK